MKDDAHTTAQVTMTRPFVSGTGDMFGTRDSMRFTVVVEAVANGAIANPPSTISFQLRRTSVDGVDVAQLTGELVAGVNPPTYRGFWNVTKAKGRWNIQVETPHRSNSTSFKVVKRGQIVEVAKSWDGANKGDAGGGKLCDDFARYVYGYVGLTIPPPAPPAGVPVQAGTVTALFYSMKWQAPDTGRGAIAFYQFPTDTTSWRHNGVAIDGGEIADQNCGLSHDKFDLPPIIGKHSDRDAGLLAPPQGTGRYNPPTYYSTQELQDLDAE